MNGSLGEQEMLWDNESIRECFHSTAFEFLFLLNVFSVF